MATPSTSRRPSVLTPTAIIVAIETMPPPSRASRKLRRSRGSTLDGPGEEGVHPPVDILDQATDLAFGGAGGPCCLERVETPCT